MSSSGGINKIETDFSKERRLVRQDALNIEETDVPLRKYHSEEHRRLEKSDKLFSRSLQDTNVQPNTKRTFVLLRDKSYSLIDVDAFLNSHQNENTRGHERKRLEFKTSSEESTGKESNLSIIIFVIVMFILGLLIIVNIYSLKNEDLVFIEAENEFSKKTRAVKEYLNHY